MTLVRSVRLGIGFALAIAAMAIAAGSAAAASYPGGGSGFSGGAEGWSVKAAACTVPIGLCSASGGYDAGAGNPAGSFGEKTSVAISAVGLFNATVSAESPDFVAGAGGSGSLSLQRQFVPGGLVTLTPVAKYTASVVDKTAGATQQAVAETISAASGFAAKGGAVSLVSGHTYAIRIDAEVNSSIATIGLLGESILRFDNVVLTDSSGANGENGTNGGDGGAGGDGKSGLSDARLATMVQSSLVGPAVLKGNRLFVKAKCPASIGHACTDSLLGLLKKNRSATSKRTAKIGAGQTKQLVLRVKPKAKGKVAKKSRLLFKEGVKAGGAKATVYKRLKLIRRR